MDFEQAAAEFANVDSGKLTTVSRLAHRQLQLQNELELLAEREKQLNDELRQVSEDLLPSAMAEAQLSEFKLDNGAKVTVAPYYSASISKDHQDEAYDWLREHGHGSLIKNVVSVAFGRGEDEKANTFIRQTLGLGYNVDQKLKVEPMTLKAFVKEQLTTEGGDVPPADLFGIFTGTKATIKLPRKKG